MTPEERVARAACRRQNGAACKVVCKICRDDAAVAIEAHIAALADAGLVIVRRKPTQRAIAVCTQFLIDRLDSRDGVAEKVGRGLWKVMMAENLE